MCRSVRKGSSDSDVCGHSNGGHPVPLPQVQILGTLQNVRLILNATGTVSTAPLGPWGPSEATLLDLQPVRAHAKLSHDPHMVSPGQVASPGLAPHPGLRCKPAGIGVELEPPVRTPRGQPAQHKAAEPRPRLGLQNAPTPFPATFQPSYAQGLPDPPFVVHPVHPFKQCQTRPCSE